MFSLVSVCPQGGGYGWAHVPSGEWGYAWFQVHLGGGMSGGGVGI